MDSLLMENKVLNLDKSSWVLTKLGDLAKDISKRVDNPGESKYDRFVGLGNFVSGDIKIKTWETTENLASSAKAFQAGDILFARRNTYLRRASLVDFDGCCSGDAFVLREDHDKLVPGFLAFLMNSNALWDYANSNAAGTMSKRVKWRDLAEYEFLLPPKDQQAQLAKLLWGMEEVIEKESLLSDKLKSLFDSFSQKYFKKDVTEYLPLSECSDVIMGQSPPGDSYNKLGKGAPLLNGPTEFTDRYPVKIQWTTKPTKYCKDNDILLCVRGNTTGKINISNDKYCIGRGVAAIRGKSIFKTDFLEFVLRYNVDEIMRVASGSTFPNIDSKTLKAIKIPKLSKQQQDVIIEKLKNLDKTKTEIQSKISQSLQKSIINQIF